MNNPADEVRLSEREDGVELQVKAVPGSSRNQIVGIWNSALRVAVTAPPEAGRANRQIIQLLAETFGVRRGAVAITHGLTQPLKRVRITGLSADQARATLSTL